MLVIGKLLGDKKIIENTLSLKKYYKDVEKAYSCFDEMCKLLYEIDLRLNRATKKF